MVYLGYSSPIKRYNHVNVVETIALFDQGKYQYQSKTAIRPTLHGSIQLTCMGVQLNEGCKRVCYVEIDVTAANIRKCWEPPKIVGIL